ncbi:MAG TPA: hypothetical protein VGK19_22425 [Capsulimonadaceae bacterium]|jgi:hypothetical protein
MTLSYDLEMLITPDVRYPEIWLMPRDSADVETLLVIFTNLAAGDRDEIVLVQRPSSGASDPFAVVLRTTTDSRPRKRLYHGREAGAEFPLWINTLDGWAECRDLMEPVAHSEHACHQYFTFPDFDDALVVVSYME